MTNLLCTNWLHVFTVTVNWSMLRRICLVTVTITGLQMKVSLWMVNALNSMVFPCTMTTERLEQKKTIRQNTVVSNKWRRWVLTPSVQLITLQVHRPYKSQQNLVCWFRKRPLIRGMAARNLMTTGVSLKKMLLTQKPEKVKSGLTMIFVPWSKEIKITQLSSCGLSGMKLVKQMERLTLLQRLNA